MNKDNYHEQGNIIIILLLLPLGHISNTCIFCTSNPRGQTAFFASYVLSGNSLSFGSISFIITSNFPNPSSDTPFSAFHCSNSSVVPSFLLSPTQFGYNNFL